MVKLDNIKTEKRNPNTMEIDRVSTVEMVRIINRENRRVEDAVDAIAADIAAAVDAIAEAFTKGGHLYYIGAGTSGRLGVLDASECPPTFGVEDTLVVGIIAGGDGALRKSAENAEDSETDGYNEIRDRGVTANDVVCGIAASGRTPYVLGALRAAKEAGAVTVSVTGNPGCPLDDLADHKLSADVGPEVITGSTRLKCGTAQKLILNMLSTGAMIRTGKVFSNLMINVKATNEKLRARAAGIVSEILDIPREEAAKLLSDNGYSIRRVLDAQSNTKE